MGTFFGGSIFCDSEVMSAVTPEELDATEKRSLSELATGLPAAVDEDDEPDRDLSDTSMSSGPLKVNCRAYQA